MNVSNTCMAETACGPLPISPTYLCVISAELRPELCRYQLVASLMPRPSHAPTWERVWWLSNQTFVLNLHNLWHEHHTIKVWQSCSHPRWYSTTNTSRDSTSYSSDIEINGYFKPVFLLVFSYLTRRRVICHVSKWTWIFTSMSLLLFDQATNSGWNSVLHALVFWSGQSSDALCCSQAAHLTIWPFDRNTLKDLIMDLAFQHIEG